MQERNNAMDNEKAVMPVSEKYMLTIKEASVYFNIGIKKMRRLVEITLDDSRFSVGTGISSSARNLRSSWRNVPRYKSLLFAVSS